MLTIDGGRASSIIKILSSLDTKLSAEANGELKQILAFGNRVITTNKKYQVVAMKKRDNTLLAGPDITRSIRMMVNPLDKVILQLERKEGYDELVKNAKLVRNMLLWKANHKLIHEKDNRYNEEMAKSLTHLLTAIVDHNINAIESHSKVFTQAAQNEGFFRKRRFAGNRFFSSVKGIVIALQRAKKEGGNPLVMFGNAVHLLPGGIKSQVSLDKTTQKVLTDFNQSLAKLEPESNIKSKKESPK